MFRIAQKVLFVLSLYALAQSASRAEAGPVRVSVQSPTGQFRPFLNNQSVFAQKQDDKFQGITAAVESLNLKFWYLDTGPGWPKVSNGETTFTVLDTGPVWMLTTTRFNGGGNSSGDWMPDVTHRSQLEAQGWHEIHAGIFDGQHNYLIFERNSVAGEIFTYRTEKYIPPIVLSGAAPVPEPSTLVLAAIGIMALFVRRLRIEDLSAKTQ